LLALEWIFGINLAWYLPDALRGLTFRVEGMKAWGESSDGVTLWSLLLNEKFIWASNANLKILFDRINETCPANATKNSMMG
jgi:hypothetical protein